MWIEEGNKSVEAVEGKLTGRTGAILGHLP